MRITTSKQTTKLMTDETKYVQCLKINCPLAWNRVHKENDARILSLAQKTTINLDYALEVRSNVYVRFLEKIAQFKGKSSVWTYLYKLTNFEAINFMTQKNCNKYQSVDQVIDEDGEWVEGGKVVLQVDHSNPCSLMERKEIKDEIDRAVDNLPEDQRRAYILHDAGMTDDELKDELHLTLDQSKKLLQKGKATLKIVLAGLYKRICG
jgi:RNA polymerase sigma-70 factor (ECF subfamily)